MTRLRRKFSANLGLLFTEYSLPDAIIAAHQCGFDAVECHWPYDVAAADLRAALAETGLRMLGINTARGDINQNEFGLNAQPGREDDAREAIDQAIDYARDINAASIHMMAGVTSSPDRFQIMAENIRYAAEQAPEIMFLIEPINTIDIPDYALTDMGHAAAILEKVNKPNLKIMFDCYHMAKMGFDVTALLKTHIASIGHIQFASTPDRASPDQGAPNYHQVFDAISALGYDAPLGAEYRPEAATRDSLNWMEIFR